MRYALQGLVAASLLAIVSPTMATGRCVLPVADGGDTEPSPASVVGRIVSVDARQMRVVVSKSKSSQVLLAPDTELFTVYGGGVEVSELRPGQHALVWFKGCAAPKRGAPVAAVVQICSVSPEPCPS
ncbi:MAG: hypothetical protein HOQ32_02160 [Lysobacter sp.]|nr:hypothetical protein [Lysobacter sp.]